MIGAAKKLAKTWNLLDGIRKTIEKLKRRSKQNSRDIVELQHQDQLIMQHVKWLVEENNRLNARILEIERREFAKIKHIDPTTINSAVAQNQISDTSTKGKRSEVRSK